MGKINLTKIVFGKNAIENLSQFAKEYKKAFLITGANSIKRNGLYESIKQQLKIANIKLVEFWNIKPNPTNVQINEAASFGIKNKVDLIIAAGGGSAIDASKVIATMIANTYIKESWQLVTKEIHWEKQPIDIISIITLAGTASENNAGTVITNEQLAEKMSIRTRAPILAIEDPTYTFSVSPWQTASGIFDCFSHITEQWFSLKGFFDWTDNYNIGLLKTLLKNAIKVLVEPYDYQARANILFTSSMALNGLSSFEMPSNDWSIHAMAHAIAGVYDTTHGATLALITPSYWQYMAENNKFFQDRLIKLGKAIFHTNNVEKIIKKLIEFINVLKLPLKYSDLKVLPKINDQEIQIFLNKIQNYVSTPKKHLEKIYHLIPK